MNKKKEEENYKESKSAFKNLFEINFKLSNN
jgi:hypothetical protein